MLLRNWLLGLKRRPLAHRHSRRRRYSPPALCEPLEQRILLTVIAQSDSYQLQHDTTLNQSAPGVLSNDFIYNGSGTLTASLVSGPSHADAFQLNSNGSFDYTPNENWAGTDSFTYEATNGSSSATATVTLTVNNFAPSAGDDSYDVLFDVFDTAALGLRAC